jgi:hypothetical protein
MIVEDVERRVWCALRPIDAVTRLPIDSPLRVHGPGQTWRPNRVGLPVLHALTEPAAQRDEFVEYEDTFPAPTAVTAVTIRTTIEDRAGRYLARSIGIALPRADFAALGVLPPLFEPIDVPMYPAPSAPLAAPWAILRVHVERGGQPAAGGVITVHEPGDESAVLGRGQTDARGEAVVAVPGVPVFIPSGGPNAFVRELDAELTAVLETAAAGPPDTDALAGASGAGFARNTVAVVLASGRSTPLNLVLP